MNDALIGRTGFVGTTLLRQRSFDASFNRSDIASARGAQFGTVICAAAPGSMFEANRFPDADSAAIDALIDELAQMRARRFVLISTIAVLADFDGGDDERTQAFQEELAYGRNRRRLEEFCRTHFDACLIVRLPALVGEGLKKNFLFDMANPVPSMLNAGRLEDTLAALPAALRDPFAQLYASDPALGLLVVDRAAVRACPLRTRIEEALLDSGMSALGFTHPESRFQYYDMRALNADIERALAGGCDIIHLAPEPVDAGTLHRHVTGRDMGGTAARIHREDMHTAFSGLWGRSGPYIADADDVLKSVGDHFAGVQRA